ASPRDEGDGWVSYAWEGAPLSHADLDGDVLERMGTYCAMRPSLCPAALSATVTSSLEAMVAKNLELAFGRGAAESCAPTLVVHRPAVVDGRMLPHEWLRRPDGTLAKSDGIAHGDDHFFPGPTDIAWDLAGALVEWRLDASAAERLLGAYERASGDDPR